MSSRPPIYRFDARDYDQIPAAVQIGFGLYFLICMPIILIMVITELFSTDVNWPAIFKHTIIFLFCGFLLYNTIKRKTGGILDGLSFIQIDADQIQYRFGSFRISRIPRSSILSVEIQDKQILFKLSGRPTTRIDTEIISSSNTYKLEELKAVIQAEFPITA